MTKIGEALAATPRNFKGPRCSVLQLLGSLPKDERAALEDAITGSQRSKVTSTALSIAISSAYGVDIHRASIDRHRREECLCSRREAK